MIKRPNKLQFRRYSNVETYQLILKSLLAHKQKSSLSCPHCNSHHLVLHGKYRDRQRYKCKNCSRTFNDLTHTPLHYLHLPHQFIEFLLCVTRGFSLHLSAVHVGISYVTAFYWRHKIIHVLQQLEKLRALHQFTPKTLPGTWTSRFITFRYRIPLRLPGMNLLQQQKFKDWMSYYHLICIKYLNRYLAWFRFLENLPKELPLGQMKHLLVQACSITLEQTYQSVREGF